MSSNLEWEPTTRKTGTLSTALKFVLRKRFGEPIKRAILGEADQDYLTALSHAGVEGVNVLIEAIEKHGEIELNEIY